MTFGKYGQSSFENIQEVPRECAGGHSPPTRPIGLQTPLVLPMDTTLSAEESCPLRLHRTGMFCAASLPYLVWSVSCARSVADDVGDAHRQTKMPTKKITFSELEQHNTKDDCWMAIHGKVCVRSNSLEANTTRGVQQRRQSESRFAFVTNPLG
jgi:cytochrome b involved in lipid metabolism